MVYMSKNDVQSQADISGIILVYKWLLQPVMLGLALRSKCLCILVLIDLSKKIFTYGC